MDVIARMPPPRPADVMVAAACADVRSAVRGPRRIGLLALTLALGVVAGVAIAALGRPADRPFAAVQGTLAAVPLLRGAREWLTPYACAQHVLSGTTTPLMRVQALVVLLLWGVALPAFGASRPTGRSGG
jgi:hypothetical protein